MQIKEVMNEKVYTISPSDTVHSAASKMSEEGVSCLLVMGDEEPLGIVTRRDILEKVVVPGDSAGDVRVEDIMSGPVKTISPDAFLVAASGVMKQHRIKQLPVVADGTLKGIITQTDIVANLHSLVRVHKEDGQ